MSTNDSSLMTHPSNLAKLMALEDPGWSDSDLAAMLRHQLELKMEFDANRMSIGELLARKDAPEQSLRLMKEFFKRSRVDMQSALPTDIATVLYYAAIVAARVRYQLKISSLDDDAVRSGIEWSLRRPWLAVQLKELFEEARVAMEGHKS